MKITTKIGRDLVNYALLHLNKYIYSLVHKLIIDYKENMEKVKQIINLILNKKWKT